MVIGDDAVSTEVSQLCWFSCHNSNIHMNGGSTAIEQMTNAQRKNCGSFAKVATYGFRDL